jgi:hypothetical protein
MPAKQTNPAAGDRGARQDSFGENPNVAATNSASIATKQLPLAPTQAFSLDEVRVGTRHRRDMGDIAGLAASIEDIGLLNPITVDETGMLLAGARRYAACKLLGWKEVPVNVLRGT